LAVSDNGQYLYVAFSNAAFVQRIDLGTMAAGPSFNVPTDPSGQPAGAADMEVITGQPLSVAVLSARFDIYVGIFVFDSGVQRPNALRSADFKALAPGPNNSLLYSLGLPGFTRLSLNGSGVTILDGTPFDGTGGGTIPKLESDGNYCFTASGAVLDAVSPKSLGKFPGLNNSALVAPDVARGRV